MPTRLSSLWTPFYKLVFPPFWIGGFGLGTILMWTGGMDDPEPPAFVKWQFLLMWIAGTSFILWFTRRLSEVWLDEGELVVKSGRYVERIPLGAVDSVTETRIWNPKQIKLGIRPGAASKEQVIFMAPWSFQLPFSDHRVVRQLRAAARAQGGTSADPRYRS
jgi:hypothetical protein